MKMNVLLKSLLCIGAMFSVTKIAYAETDQLNHVKQIAQTFVEAEKYPLGTQVSLDKTFAYRKVVEGEHYQPSIHSAEAFKKAMVDSFIEGSNLPEDTATFNQVAQGMAITLQVGADAHQSCHVEGGIQQQNQKFLVPIVCSAVPVIDEKKFTAEMEKFKTSLLDASGELPENKVHILAFKGSELVAQEYKKGVTKSLHTTLIIEPDENGRFDVNDEDEKFYPKSVTEFTYQQ